MNERGVSTVLSVLMAAMLGCVVALILMDWVVVDVETVGEDGVHLVIPAPLLAARAASQLLPEELTRELTVPPELRENRDTVINALHALLEAPDRTLVSVSSPEADVEITKSGDTLQIDVHAPDAVVTCAVPLDGLERALERWDWQTFEPGLALDVLDAAGGGTLLRVDAEDAKVVLSRW